MFANNLLKYVTLNLWNINSQLASLTCHLPLLTCPLYFNTHNFRITSNHPFVVAAKPKNGHLLSYKLLFYILYKMALMGVEYFSKIYYFT